MGNLQSSEYAQAEVPLEVALTCQLRSNHYPPYPHALIPIAAIAVRRANDELDPGIDKPFDDTIYNEMIALPDGIQFRDRKWITVGEAIEVFHLDAFIRRDEEC